MQPPIERESIPGDDIHGLNALQTYNEFLILQVGAARTVKEDSEIEQGFSDEAETETSPTKSPTSPKKLKSKNSSGTE